MKFAVIGVTALILSLGNTGQILAKMPENNTQAIFATRPSQTISQNNRERDNERYYDQINEIYRDILGRDADYRGLRTWSREIERGASVREIRREIAESDEARDAINNVYRNMLGRNADSSGMRTWTRTLTNGGNLEDVRERIADSREAEDAINRVYRQLLGRDADQGGMRTWKRQLANGATLRDIQREIANSEEARQRNRR